MRFSYQYKTSDGTRHSGVYAASSREAVYDELKRKGIRPFGVEPLPGFLNRVSGVSKRAVAIAVLAVAVVILSAGLLRLGGPAAGDSVLASQTRHQIIGDTAVIEMGIRTGWAETFPEEGERFLASFAVPGVPAAVRTTSEKELAAALARTIVVTANDSIENRQIKMLVEGMKNELRAYLAQGGIIRLYGERIVERQDREIEFYESARKAVEDLVGKRASGDEILRVWKSRNDELRRMGIRLVSLPEAK